MIVPDGGVTDEPMPLEWMRAYAEAYPELLADYVRAAREAEEEARRALGGEP